MARSRRPTGVSERGLGEAFSTAPPVSLYGATKLASETLALEYGHTFGFPAVVNRCGVLAGETQFGVPEQGIYSFWIRMYALRRPLKYLGFNGTGHQVRDALHPNDLADLLLRQIENPQLSSGKIWNVGGGAANCMSLAQLSRWCADTFGEHTGSGRWFSCARSTCLGWLWTIDMWSRRSVGSLGRRWQISCRALRSITVKIRIGWSYRVSHETA